MTKTPVSLLPTPWTPRAKWKQSVRESAGCFSVAKQFQQWGKKKDDEINFNSCLNPHCYSYSVQMTEKKKSVSFRWEKNLQEKS